jgi:UDP-N-acetylglucosamine 2-epimerase (non-hydrolysing)
MEGAVTVTLGTNRLVTPEGLGAAADAALAGELRRPGEGPALWDGHAGERITGILAAVVGVPEAIA